MNLDSRQEQILSIVVRQYVKNAQPVGSKLIQKEYGFALSSATIRNEMSALKEMGYLAQPHISAGRVPTAKGYRYYIDHSLQEVKPDLAPFIRALEGPQKGEERFKKIAKELSMAIEGGVFVSFPPSYLYYTGLSFLFNQPEFVSSSLMKSMGAIFDHLEETVEDLYGRLQEDEDVEVFLGQENPFGNECCTVILKYQTPNAASTGLLGVMGPLRMDYDRTLPLLRGLQKILK